MARKYVEVDDEKWTQLKEFAKKNGRTLSGQLDEILKNWLAKQSKKS